VAAIVVFVPASVYYSLLRAQLAAVSNVDGR